MTLKFPLVNLISRGHLPLSNRTACLNFAKNIEDGPATRICYEMMKFDDTHDAAKFLEEAVEAHREMTEGSRAYFAESDNFANARDMILIREAAGDMREEVDEAINPYKQFMTLVKAGGMGAGIMYLLKLSSKDQQNIMRNLHLYNRKLYDAVQDNVIGRKVLRLPNDHGAFFKRMFNSAVGRSKDTLKPAEVRKVKDFGKAVARGAGWGVAIAASLTTAIVAITMLYKQRFSAEAKACKAYGGKERTVCMTKARIKSCDAAIAAAKKALLECGSAKNEEDCMFKMKVEIRSWTKKKVLEEEKLRKLTNVNSSSFDDKPIKKNDPFA